MDKLQELREWLEKQKREAEDRCEEHAKIKSILRVQYYGEAGAYKDVIKKVGELMPKGMFGVGKED